MKRPTIALATPYKYYSSKVGMMARTISQVKSQALRAGINEWWLCGDFSDSGNAAIRALTSDTYPFRIIDKPCNVGEARNLISEATSCDIIICIDSDDWQHPDRIEKQVAALMLGAQVVGTTWIYTLVPRMKRVFRASCWGMTHSVPGCTMAYWKEAWKRHPFPNTFAEDGPFCDAAFKAGGLVDMCDPELVVYIRHDENGSDERWCLNLPKGGTRKNAIEMMKERISNPGIPLRPVWEQTVSDKLILHDSDVHALYVKNMMGNDFERYLR